MAEALGIDKDKPKEAVTVAVKMLKGKPKRSAWPNMDKRTAVSRSVFVCDFNDFLKSLPVCGRGF